MISLTINTAVIAQFLYHANFILECSDGARSRSSIDYCVGTYNNIININGKTIFTDEQKKASKKAQENLFLLFVGIGK